MFSGGRGEILGRQIFSFLIRQFVKQRRVGRRQARVVHILDGEDETLLIVSSFKFHSRFQSSRLILSEVGLCIRNSTIPVFISEFATESTMCLPQLYCRFVNVCFPPSVVWILKFAAQTGNFFFLLAAPSPSPPPSLSTPLAKICSWGS